MATYRDFEKYVRANYNVPANEPDAPKGLLRMLFDVGDNRSQQVFIRRGQSEEHGETADVLSFLGELSGTKLEKALEEASTLIAGGLVKIGKGIAYRLTILLEDVDESEIKKSITIAVFGADHLEEMFVGGDEH